MERKKQVKTTYGRRLSGIVNYGRWWPGMWTVIIDARRRRLSRRRSSSCKLCPTGLAVEKQKTHVRVDDIKRNSTASHIDSDRPLDCSCWFLLFTFVRPGWFDVCFYFLKKKHRLGVCPTVWTLGTEKKKRRIVYKIWPFPLPIYNPTTTTTTRVGSSSSLALLISCL